MGWLSNFLKWLTEDHSWVKIDYDELPRWMKKAYTNWYNKQAIRPYDKIVYFKGKHFRYKIFCETIAQGQIRENVWRKLRRK